MSWCTGSLGTQILNSTKKICKKFKLGDRLEKFNPWTGNLSPIKLNKKFLWVFFISSVKNNSREKFVNFLSLKLSAMENNELETSVSSAHPFCLTKQGASCRIDSIFSSKFVPSEILERTSFWNYFSCISKIIIASLAIPGMINWSMTKTAI